MQRCAVLGELAGEVRFACPAAASSRTMVADSGPLVASSAAIELDIRSRVGAVLSSAAPVALFEKGVDVRRVTKAE